jgi:hypothetical protein
MDDMVADMGRGYNLESADPPPKVQNFYRLLAACRMIPLRSYCRL